MLTLVKNHCDLVLWVLSQQCLNIENNAKLFTTNRSKMYNYVLFIGKNEISLIFAPLLVSLSWVLTHQLLDKKNIVNQKLPHHY